MFPLLITKVSYAAEEFLDLKTFEPRTCARGACPIGLYDTIYPARGEKCVETYEDFKKDPYTSHYWIEDPDITDQGKADERARQFIFWVVHSKSIDNNSQVLSKIWITTRNVSYFFVIIVAVILGLGFIVGQRANFNLKIKVWPAIQTIGLALLYITFSAAIVFALIQFSELLMRFFIDNLGGKDLFNIYFSAVSQEKNYVDFIGCRDINFRVQEGAHAELFLLKLTNITYYVMGSMLLLRKIILWFLLFVSPFLALLMPFVFIRNVGWIWIGVFFQWLFYGPLFALFLGGLATIWKEGIPFQFDFSRVSTPLGYVYPTAIIITYGGPAQTLGPLNNGNYIDTFAEYIITLIMLWAVIFFPWWLLRIFRDYCCDGIYAMKNILLAMYDNYRSGPPGSPQSPAPAKLSTTIKTPNEVNVPVKVKLETLQEIKSVKTEEIKKSLDLSATKLTDIARIETNKQTQASMRRNMDLLSNPMKADSPTERQKFMNIRSELFTRAIKEDTIAKQILSATSTSRIEQIQRKEELVKTTTQAGPSMAQTISVKVKLPQERINQISTSFTNTVSQNTSAVTSISQKTSAPVERVQSILSSYSQNISQPSSIVTKRMSAATGFAPQEIANVMQQVSNVVQSNPQLVKEVADKEKVEPAQVKTLIEQQIPLMIAPEKHVEQTIAIPPSISIEDYEEVKKMWTQQYQKGEVPVQENIKTREEWVNQDIIFITNTLNKLLSTEDKAKNEGLDELGYILPIFMLNNLKGPEIMVYLKAKLEAAKATLDQLEKEKEIREEVKAEKDKNDLVDVERPKERTAAKTMEQSLELDPEKPKDAPTTTTAPTEEPKA